MRLWWACASTTGAPVPRCTTVADPVPPGQRRAFDSYLKKHLKQKLWFYTRSGFTDSPGSAAFEGANFLGDETSDWTRASGLASLTPDMPQPCHRRRLPLHVRHRRLSANPAGTDKE